MLHRLAHLFSIQHGNVVTVSIDGSTKTWIAFQCSTCGDICCLTEPLGFDWIEVKRGRSRNGVRLNEPVGNAE